MHGRSCMGWPGKEHLGILNSTPPCETKVPAPPLPPNNDGVRGEQDFSRENLTSGAKHHCLGGGGGAAGTEFRSGLNDSAPKNGCSYTIYTSPRWTPGTPYNAHGRRPAPRGQSPRSVPPTQPTTTYYYIRPTGNAPRRGGNRGGPIASRRQH